MFPAEEELDEAAVWEVSHSAASERRETEDTGLSKCSGKENHAAKGAREATQPKRKAHAEDALTSSTVGVECEAHDKREQLVGGKRGSSTLVRKSSDTSEGLTSFIPIAKKFLHADEAYGKEDGDEFPIQMGTSAPINIPVKSLSKDSSVEQAGNLSRSFIPPHLISRQGQGTQGESDTGEVDLEVLQSSLSSSMLKKDQIKHRNSVLQQTGFL